VENQDEKGGRERMEKNKAKICIISTGKRTYVELDGKTIGTGVRELKYSTHDEDGNMKGQLELKINLDEFEFMDDDKFDKAYQTLRGTAMETAPAGGMSGGAERKETAV